MARDTVITVGFEESFFGCRVVAGGFGSASLFLPSRTQFIPYGRPRFAFDTRQFCEGFLGFVFIGMIERRSMAHPAANIIFDLVEGSWLVHTGPFLFYTIIPEILRGLHKFPEN